MLHSFAAVGLRGQTNGDTVGTGQIGGHHQFLAAGILGEVGDDESGLAILSAKHESGGGTDAQVQRADLERGIGGEEDGLNEAPVQGGDGLEFGGVGDDRRRNGLLPRGWTT